MANWYSADLHFGHHRIIDFCKRPFASTAEMNAALIANFQACVAHDDDLWILGDFAFGRADDTAQFESWFHSLPGRKHLIIGNHDDEAVISLPWASTEYMAEIQDGDRWIHQAIRYDDDYRRVEGRWLFLRRNHRLFYGAEVGRNPLALAPANWPEHHTGTGTLPHEEPTWQAFHGSDGEPAE